MIEIYCDESRPEVMFSRNSTDQYMIIGGVWLPNTSREKVKREINSLKQKHSLYGEIKWKNVSPSKVEFFKELIDLFFSTPDLRFRCIIVDSNDVDLESYHNSDSELGFYKFYYQLLKHWIDSNQDYWIFLDHKKNKMPDRLHTLERVLQYSTPGNIKEVQAIESKESLLIQLADVLMGAVGYNAHSINTSQAKLSIVAQTEKYLNTSLSQGTSRNSQKFNVFRINLR